MFVLQKSLKILKDVNETYDHLYRLSLHAGLVDSWDDAKFPAFSLKDLLLLLDLPCKVSDLLLVVHDLSLHLGEVLSQRW